MPMFTPSNEQIDPPSLQATPTTATATPSRTNIVPLIAPKYQKKQRTQRHIEVTDSSEDRLSATKALQQHTKEVLMIQNGPVKYEQEMYFHPYELYKHGKHQIHTRSIGYSSEGDFVITRESISEPSDVDLGFVRRHAEIDKAICLDPKARRPITEKEVGKKLRLNAPRYRKYPGIRVPKNRKERNRLLNDYFATEYARKIMEKYRERQANGDVDSDMSPPIRPAFGNLPPVFYDMLDLDEDAQTRALERCGVKVWPTVVSNNNNQKDPDSGEARFQAMNSRLRGELIHALNSVFLSNQIDDLERAFSSFVAEGNVNKPLVYNFRDGYGRLVCHGVAAYYQLVSESQHQPDGSKITVVSWPRKKKQSKTAAGGGGGSNNNNNNKSNAPALHLPHISLMQLLKHKRGGMPGCSPASTPQSTPCGHPAEAEMMPPPFYLDDSPEIPEVSKFAEDSKNLNISPAVGLPAVYNPPAPLRAADGSGMTATQRKKIRKAQRGATREVGEIE